MANPLLDKDFLREIDKMTIKEIYAEIIALNEEEEVLETIEGYITSGNINIDGSSSVRRTCSLTLVANELNIHEYYWGLHTKFKLSIGVKNTINSNYPEIIWFPQGTYVISSFNTSQTLSSYTVSIQGKDKMTLLNGELGGTITALTHNFGEYDYTNENGYTATEKNLIKDIIIDAVHEFGKEPLYNIIVNDLEDYGLELMEYRGKNPVYLLISQETQEPENITLDGKQKYKLSNGTEVTLDNIKTYNPLFDLEQEGIVVKPTIIYDNARKPYTVAKLEYGMTAGYKLTGITYAGDLILNVGETVTAMLDRLVDMLGEFEYYYDIDGRFIFQRRKTYISTAFNNIINNFDETYVENAAYTSAISYSFENDLLVNSFTNNPNYANLKNDFSIWGTKKSVTGKELPVHMRYAIDIKPKEYVNYDGTILYSVEPIKSDIENKVCDWREIIYQMAIDFRRHNREDEFYITIRRNNPETCPKGMTGYEQYYTDMEGFWRQLYNPEYENSYEQSFVTKAAYELEPSKYYYSTPHYTQCNETIPYHSTVTYYSYEPDKRAGTRILKEKVGLTKVDYYKNPKLYYYINPEIPYDIISCIIIEPYRDLDKTYYNKNHTVIHNVSKAQYEAAPQNYYFLDRIEYLPCAQFEDFQDYYTYYYKSNNTVANGLTEEKYLKNPSLYYRIEKEYKRCSKNIPYNDKAVYYQKEKEYKTDREIYVSISISKERYDLMPDKYYTYVRDYNVLCSRVKEPYNVNRVYKINGKTPIKFSNATEYNNRVLVGDIYYENKIYLCCKRPIEYDPSIFFYISRNDEYNSDGWVKDVYLNPEGLNFWFDFLDEDSELQKYSCHNIGDRTKAVNDNQVKAIYFRETPTVIFVGSNEWEEKNNIKLGYTYVKLPENMENLFTISAQGKSAKNVLDDYLYRYACCAETITISTLPIYHLEPNTRIFVSDEHSGINGEYIMTRYGIPLGSSGNMSISATKAIDRLY